MCGIAGFTTFRPFDDSADAARKLEIMTRAIAHRGPDAEGYWLDDGAGVALGHRRLSILDLSPSGAQPMQSPCKRYVIVFNGEIYNHQALRADLMQRSPAPEWHGHSDTETLLVAIATWGLEQTLKKAFGMFALALWDRRERVLSLARDRMGEKPLYFSQRSGEWLFGSELRALRAASLPIRIEPAALAAYLELGYVPDHLCILAEVRKVGPGAIVNLRPGADPEECRYARIETQFEQPRDCTDSQEATASLGKVLEEVVSDQMISDVPLGCFLSGGVDSSLVASLMQARSDRQIGTFSIGFEDARFNEAPHAAAVAKHLGTSHTEFIVTEDDALAVVPDLPGIYDEPFADSSQIPTTLLCRAARQHVTVALTGDGGDEIFGGYNRHIRGPELWRKILRTPYILRRVGAGAVDTAAKLGLRHQRAGRRAAAALGLPLTTLENLPKLAATLRTAGEAEDFYRTFISTGSRLKDALLAPPVAPPPDPQALHASCLDMAEWMMARDMTGYLPGDILVKVDRAAMSVGLETRAPFLDVRVTDFARRIPIRMHVDAREGKKLLRALLYRHVPRPLIERPKQGFAIPLDDWLRGALKDWGAKLMANQDLAARLGLDRGVLQEIWRGHQEQRFNAGKELWTLLMLLLWAEDLGV